MNIKEFCKENLSKSQVRVLRRVYGDLRFLYRRIVSPEYMLKRMFRKRVGYQLDLNNPKTFNEKLQWLKLHDHNPLYTTMVDKYAVKEYVADKIGAQYIIPTLGVWDHFDEIEFDKLPDQFVLKCTHDSGSVVVVADKGKIDKDVAKEKLENGLRHNYYYAGYEWPYKNVPPRIIAEKFMADEKQSELGLDDMTDYKFMCFNGIVRCVFTCTDRRSDDGLKVTFFDNDWKQLPFERHYPAAAAGSIKRPNQFGLMKQLAEKLSENIPFVRVDFYEINNQVYFGELTFYPGAGMEEFSPEKYDYILGEWIKLPNVPRGGDIFIGDGFYLWLHTGEPVVSKQNCANSQLANYGLIDYKFHCFNGYVDSVMLCLDRGTSDTKFYFFDREWRLKRYNVRGQKAPENFTIPKPPNMEEMFSIAETLAEDFPFVRVDLYSIAGQTYFGELTFYPQSGFDSNLLRTTDEYWGDLIDLDGKI